ncbi:MAG: MBL fold metallo-hydrolase [archaeon]
MKVTKFAQSCFLIQYKEIRVLIDPGNMQTDDAMINACKNPDLILITHKHADHFDEELVKKLISANTKIYSSHEVAEAFSNTNIFPTRENNILMIGGLNIQATKAIHGYTPLLKGGKEIEEGLGFLIDDGIKTIYHTGDTISFQNHYACNLILLPFNDHGLVMGPFDAALYAKETGATMVVPMHYDNQKYPGDKQKLEEELTKNGLKFKWLNNGESIEL